MKPAWHTASRRPIIALLTDFGTRDWYVSALKGVLLARCPNACLVDVTHEIPPQDVTAGAFTLAAAVPWFPPGTVFLAVVDPGVGTTRALLAMKYKSRYLVGPDNGLMSLSVRMGIPLQIVRITNPRFRLTPTSRTFHGRDILAPAAAHLASGGRLSQLGPRTARLAALRLPAVRYRGGVAHGCVIHIDAFGNLVTNVPARLLMLRRAAPRITYKRRRARFVPSYAHGRIGELIAVVGSLGCLELAVRDGSAASSVGGVRGETVVVHPAPRRGHGRVQ